MSENTAPPPVLHCARLLYYAVLDNSVEFAVRSLLFVDGKELGRRVFPEPGDARDVPGIAGAGRGNAGAGGPVAGFDHFSRGSGAQPRVGFVEYGGRRRWRGGPAFGRRADAIRGLALDFLY